MTEVLRLLRFSALLRLALAAVLAALAFSGMRGGPWWPSLAASVASVLTLALAWFTERRGSLSQRRVLIVLGAALLINMAEILVSAVLFVEARTDNARGAQAGFRLMRAPPSLFLPLTFAFLPSALGAWLLGKRGNAGWTAFVVAMFVATGGLLFAFLATELRFELSGFLAQAIIAVLINFFLATLADAARVRQLELEQANQQLVEQARMREQLASSRERVRLARDLHDTMAHSLAGLVVHIDAIDALMAQKPELARQELARVRDAAHNGLADTRNAIADLRGSMAIDLGLAGALARTVELQRAQSPAQLHWRANSDLGAFEKLPLATTDTVFRIAQEAMSNAVRHAQAHNVWVSMTHDVEAHRLIVAVKDDGIGFDPHASQADRFGLRGMRERAELIGAHLRLSSVQGQGTEIELTLPI